MPLILYSVPMILVDLENITRSVMMMIMMNVMMMMMMMMMILRLKLNVNYGATLCSSNF